MKGISKFLNEQFEDYIEDPINESKISNEKEFRAAAEAKFKEVFADDLDEKKMKDTIDGLLQDNKELADKNEWGKLIGMLNKSFVK